MRPVTLAGLVLAVLAAPVIAGEPGKPEGDEDYGRKIAELAKEIQVLSLLNDLGLSPEQEKEALEIARAGAKAREDFAREKDGIRVEMEKAFKDLKIEDEADQGLTPEIEKAARAANDRFKELEGPYAERMRALEGRLLSLLTDGQRESLKRFRSPVKDDGRIAAPARRKKTAKPSREEELIREIRSSPDGGFGRIEDKLVKLQLEIEEGRRGEPYAQRLRELREAEIRRLFAEVRTAGDEAFEEKLEAWCRELTPRTKIEEIRDGLKALSEDKGLEIGPLGKHLLTACAVNVLQARTARRSEEKKGGSK